MLGPCDMDIAKRLGAAFGFAQFMQAIPALQNAGKRPLDDGRSETLAKRAAEVQRALPLRRQISKTQPMGVVIWLSSGMDHQTSHQDARARD